MGWVTVTSGNIGVTITDIERGSRDASANKDSQPLLTVSFASSVLCRAVITEADIDVGVLHPVWLYGPLQGRKFQLLDFPEKG